MRDFLNKVKAKIYVLTNNKIKINVGSAGINHSKEWFPTDIETLDLTKESNWKNFLGDKLADNVFAEHVWEHLTDVHTNLANKNCFKYLKKGGVLRIAVPDGFHADKSYIDYVKPNGSGPGSDDHKILYNYQIMKSRLESVGFAVKLLEYWDENGNFNCVSWSNDNGYVMRSKENDRRNKDGKLAYTSLIVDAQKP